MLEMLVLVSMADWLQKRGFGGSDRAHQPYWMGGRTPGH
jgi:hypothetical protein